MPTPTDRFTNWRPCGGALALLEPPVVVLVLLVTLRTHSMTFKVSA